jgi:hypothetical protein
MKYTYHYHTEWEKPDGSLERSHGLVSTNYQVITEEGYKRLFEQLITNIKKDGANEGNTAITSLTLLHVSSDQFGAG